MVPSVLSWGAFSKRDVTWHGKKKHKPGWDLIESFSICCNNTQSLPGCHQRLPLWYSLPRCLMPDHTTQIQADYQSVRSRTTNFQCQGLFNIWKDGRTCTVTTDLACQNFLYFLTFDVFHRSDQSECSNPFFFMLELKTASITLRTWGMIDSYFLYLLLWCFTAVTILSVFPFLYMLTCHVIRRKHTSGC